MFYRIRKNKLYDWADYNYASDCIETDIITKNELDTHPNKVIIQEGILVLNPNYEQEEEEKERERISHLTMTKRICALMLQQLGISYSQLKEIIAQSEQAQLEWDLCVELERCNPLIDTIGSIFGLSPEQIDQMFKYANGEVDTLTIEGEEQDVQED